MAEAGGVEQIVRCLAREISVAKAAVNLLLELLKDGELGKNSVVYTKLEQQRSAIFCLVTLTTGKDPEAAKSAHLVLTMLADDDKNVVQMAKVNWFSPLITRFHQGHFFAPTFTFPCVIEFQSLLYEMRIFEACGDLCVLK